MTAQTLGFSHAMRNSMDAVSDHFAVEFLFNASLTAIHLSRLAEELVLVIGSFWLLLYRMNFPQGHRSCPKAQPDAAELVRAKPGGSRAA